MRALGCVVAGLLACTGSEPQAPAEVVAPPPVPEVAAPVVEKPPVVAPLADSLPALAWHVRAGERVVIRDGARLYAAPDKQATSAALRLAGRDGPKDGLTWTGSLTVVEVDGDWIEIGDNSGDAFMVEECAPPLARMYLLSMRAWIHRDDVVPVLARSVQIDLAHGTSVRLFPGVAVWPRTNDAYAVWARGVALTLPLPADALALSHAPSRERVGFPFQYDVVDPAATLTLGDAAIEGRAWLYGRRPETGAAFSPIVVGKRAVEDGWIVEVANRCSEIQAHSDRAPVFARDVESKTGNEGTTAPTVGYGPPGGLTDDVGGLERTVTAWQVEQGTPFTTLGSVAGKLRQATAFVSAPEVVGTTLCFAPDIGGAIQPELRLCFARAKVKPLAPIRVSHRVEGHVSEAMVWRLMAGRARVLFLCDDRARKQRPELAGRATLRFDVPAAGGQANVDVDVSALPGGEVFAACLKDPKNHWLKLKPEGGQPARVFYDMVIDRRDPMPNVP